jgi:hypothetical protein
MTECAAGESRHANERGVAFAQKVAVSAHRHFRYVELLEVALAIEEFHWWQVDHLEVDALGHYLSPRNHTGPIVVSECSGQSESVHVFSFSFLLSQTAL